MRLFFAEVFETFQMLQMLLLPWCEALLCAGDGEHCPGSEPQCGSIRSSQEHARLTARRMGGQNWDSK